MLSCFYDRISYPKEIEGEFLKVEEFCDILKKIGREMEAAPPYQELIEHLEYYKISTEELRFLFWASDGIIPDEDISLKYPASFKRIPNDDYEEIIYYTKQLSIALGFVGFLSCLLDGKRLGKFVWDSKRDSTLNNYDVSRGVENGI